MHHALKPRLTTTPPPIPLMLAATFALSLPLPAQSQGTFITSQTGCPALTPASGPVVYGVLPAGGWNLDGTSLTYSSNGASWTIRESGGYIQPTANATIIAASDDSIEGPFSLPFTFRYPGGAGATTAIDVASNGRVIFESGTSTFTQGYTASQVQPRFLSDTPSAAVLAVDLNPGAGGTMRFETRTIGAQTVALVTWIDVPEYPTLGANTVQCQLWSNGELTICHVATNGANANEAALVGVSAGGGSPDPGASSLAVPVRLAMVGTPNVGTSLSILASRVPATATLSQLVLGSTVPTIPIPLNAIGANPDCSLLVSDIFSALPMSLTGDRATSNLTIPLLAASVGLSIHCQALIVDPGQSFPLGILVSDRGTLTIGRRPQLRFVVEGDNSYFGTPNSGGWFRLESSALASHPPISHVVCSLVGRSQYFDTSGNSGTRGQGFFDDGNATAPGCINAFYGSDITTGLIYGPPNPVSVCDPSGFVGWTGRMAEPGSRAGFNQLEFNFQPGQFTSGETFGFDCDTDGGEFAAGAHQVRVTVTFANLATLSGVTTRINDNRAEVVLLP